MQSTLTFSLPSYSACGYPTVVRAAWLVLLAKYTGEDEIPIQQPDGALSLDISPSREIGALTKAVNANIKQVVHYHGAQIRHFFRQPLIDDVLDVPQDYRVSLDCNASQQGRSQLGAYHLQLTATVTDTDPLIVLSAYGNAVDERLLPRLLRQLRCLIESISHAPLDLQICRLECSPADDILELRRWNHVLPSAQETCLHELVFRHAASLPHKVAVEAPDGTLTYAELADTARHVAVAITRLGVRRGSLVLTLFEKSKWNTAAMLAILAAGAAFVPLDPATPPARIAAISQQCDAKIAIASSRHAVQLKPYVGSIYVINADFKPALTSPATDVSIQSSRPEDLAYAIFTSGSTGTPKGVLIEHRGIATSMVAACQFMKIDQESRVLQLASHGFDLSIMENFTALVCGGTVCIPDQLDALTDLAAEMRRLCITFCVLTPSFARSLRIENLPALTSMTMGGEAVSHQDVLSHRGRVKYLSGGYGPTETSCASAAVHLEGGQNAADELGEGLGCLNWIIDPSDPEKLAPIGAVGELVIEGAIVGRGYLNDENRTAAAFISPPDWLRTLFPHRQERLYRTGDLVRYTPSGKLQYLGRRDTQVKLRGLRIELGAIEDSMRKCIDEGINVAVDIVPFEDNASDTLVGFLAASDSAEDEAAADSGPQGIMLDESSLRRTIELAQQLQPWLAARLPPYMVPSIFCVVPKIPKTLSGKCDRRTLRSWAAKCSLQERSQKLAQLQGRTGGDDEQGMLPVHAEALSAAWKSVLGDNYNFGAQDHDFFACGANSLTAIKLIAALRSNGWDLRIQDVFLSPTFSGMAKNMKKKVLEPHVIPAFSLISNPGEVKAEIAKERGILESEIADIWPCSPAQQGMITISKRDARAYVMQHVLEIPPRVTDSGLDAAWMSASQDDPMLRSFFFENATSESGTIQVVLNRDTWPAPLPRCYADVHHFLATEKEAGIDPCKLLARASVVSGHGSDKRYLVFTMHHTFCDAWSFSALVHRLACHIEQLPVLPPASPGILARYLQECDLDAAKAAWKSYFEDMETAEFLSLPSPGYQPLSKSIHRQRLALVKPRNITATVSTLLQAAWAVIVSKHSQSARDVAFGSTVTGRSLPLAGVENMAGPTIATTPVRVRLPQSDSTTVGEFVQKVQTDYNTVMSHEQIGLAAIAKVSAEAASACRFQSLLVYQGESSDFPLNLADGFDEWAVPEATEYSIVLCVHAKEDHYLIEALYDENVIASASTQRIVNQFSHVFTELCQSDTNDLFSELNTISAQDADDIRRWNSTSAPPAEQCIHELFEQQADRTPEAQAISSWDGNLSYYTLNDMASRLAAHLRHKYRLGRGIIVPFCFEKSIWSVVAMLAVLKTGAAYTAVDPTWPSSRSRGLIDQINAKVVLGDAKAPPYLKDSALQVVVVDSAYVEACPAAVCPSLAVPQDLLFVQFTSGSTGMPKGILMNHSTFASSIAGHADRNHFSIHSRVLQYANFTFDVSMEEIFTTLATGGCVCMPSETERLEDLAGVITRHSVNWIWLTPTIASLLGPSDVPTLKHLCMGGEMAKRETIARWANDVCVHLHYGPAETTVFSHGRSAIPPNQDPSNVGYPFQCAAWIVNPDNPDQLCPVGAPGEVVTEGSIVTSGYLNRPDLTNAAYIAPPKWADSFPTLLGPRRFYKTGDLARYGEDGGLCIIGRKDSQVKLRGRRIELSEIESQLRQFWPWKCDLAAEMVRIDDGQAAPAIAAFYSSANQDSSSPQLAQIIGGTVPQLAKVLPQYMIPTLFVPLQSIPLTASGKTDRRRLRELALAISPGQAAQMQRSAQHSRPAETAREKVLIKTVAEILRLDVESLGLDDSWFLIGGDSVLAIKLVAAMRSKGYHVPVQAIFKEPNLEAVATNLQEIFDQRSQEIVSPFSQISPDVLNRCIIALSNQYGLPEAAIQDIYPFTPLQEGFWALTQKHPGSYHAQRIISLPSHIDLDRYQSAWQSVYEQFDILRTIFAHVENNTWQVVVSSPMEIRLVEAETLETFVVSDSKRCHVHGELVSQFYMVRDCSTKRDHFVWSTHHAVYDGYSMSKILSAVESAYTNQATLAAVPFRHFVSQVSQASGDAAAAFWQAELSGGKTHTFPDPELCARAVTPNRRGTRKILVKKGQSSITIATILQATWAVLQSWYTNSEDISFAMLSSGRLSTIENADLVMGPTLATLPLRCTVKGDIRIADFLRQLLEKTIACRPFEHYGLQNISKTCPEAAAACNVHNLFDIQTGSDHSKHNSPLSIQYSSGTLDGFYTYPLNVECLVDDSEVTVSMFYDPVVVAPTQIDYLLRHFEQVCNDICNAEYSKLLRDITPCTKEDLDVIAKKPWPRSDHRELSLPSVVEKAKNAYPRTVAVQAADGPLTYQELWELSTSCATLLASRGVVRGTKVLTALDKSRMAPVWVLAILKAGGTIIPIDVSCSDHQLAIVTSTSEATFGLGSSDTATRLRSLVPDVLDFTLPQMMFAAATSLPQAAPDDIAFVLHRWVGKAGLQVMHIQHGVLSAACASQIGAWINHQEAKVLQYMPWVSGLSLAEMFVTLAAGSTLCIPSDEQRQVSLQSYMQAAGITAAYLSPTLLKQLDPTELPLLQNVIVGGEELTASVASRWKKAVSLRNSYSTFETVVPWAVSASQSESDLKESNCGHTIIGKIWVVDRSNDHRPVGVGVPGRLLLQGPFSTQSMHEIASENAVFIDSPAWLHRISPLEEGCGLLRTEDLACYNADGTVEYLGKVEKHPVIDLLPAESKLSKSLPHNVPCIVQRIKLESEEDSCVVAFLKGSPEELRHAFKSEFNVSGHGLLHFGTKLQMQLCLKIPTDDRPSAFVAIPQIPTTRSGHLDREKLQEVAFRCLVSTTKLPEDCTEKFSPSNTPSDIAANEKQSLLQELWSKTLAVPLDDVFVEDDFFVHGGDSIMAMKLVSAATTRGLELTVAQIFKNPVLADMAEAASWRNTEEVRNLTPFALLPKAVDRAQPLQELGYPDRYITWEQIEDGYPCTPMQESLLAGTYRTSEDAYAGRWLYNIPESLSLEDLKKAWIEVAVALPILRTRFIDMGSAVIQVVLKDPHCILQKDRCFGFNVIFTEDNGPQMLLSAHHAVFDGWVQPQIMNALGEALSGKPLPRAAPFVSYVDYALQPPSEATEHYWREELKGAVSSDFPPVPPNHKPVTNTSTQHTFQFPPRSSAVVTEASLATAAWALLVTKYSSAGFGSSCFGLTLSGRDAPLPGIASLAGPTLVSVPFTTNMDKDMTVTEYLRDVQTRLTNLKPHEHCSIRNIRMFDAQFEELCQFKTLLGVSKVGEKDSAHELGLVPEPDDVLQIHQAAIYLQFIIDGKHVSLDAHYDSAVISSSQIERMLRQVECITHILMTLDPTTKLLDVSLLDQYDATEIKNWNKDMPETIQGCMHDYIQRNVIASPDAPAITAWDGDLTYQQLDDHASRLAHSLHSTFHLKPNDIVLLHFEKSMWAAVCMYAVHKAGCAYGFLGISDPASRMETVQSTTRARIVLTTEKLKPRVAHLPVDVFTVSETAVRQLPSANSSFRAPAGPDNLAYVLFTSGSTGVPKCVMIDHRAGVTSANHHGTAFKIDKASRVYQFAAYTFDMATSETLTTLLKGGCVCIPSEEKRLSAFVEMVNSFQVNALMLTPTVANLIKPADIPTVKTLRLGGEPVPQETVNTWGDKLSLCIGYGPCEAAIWCCDRPDVGLDADRSNCGFAVGCRMWISEAQNYHQLAMVGAIGEVLIEGPILSQGYLGNPEKTAQAFVTPNWLAELFPDRPQRVYRTGDLGRYADDGSIRIVGRIDTQVKIRGQRVELGEIEHHIAAAACPGEGRGVVMIPKSGPFAGRLVALPSFSDTFIHDDRIELMPGTSRSQVSKKLRALDSILVDKVPPYMVPDTWIPVVSIPINASGKLNRKVVQLFVEGLDASDARQIIELNESSFAAEGNLLTPSLTPTESILRDVWVRVLNVREEDITTTSNFFRLGGDSISSMQVANLCKGHGLRVTMADVMASKTLCKLATRADSSQRTTSTVSKKPGTLQQSQQLPLTPVQMMYFDHTNQHMLPFQQGFAVRIRNPVKIEVVEAAMSQIVRRHAMLRARFSRDHEGRWVQSIAEYSASSYDFQAVRLPNRDAVATCVQERQQVIDCKKGPTFVATLVDIIGHEQCLYMTCPHLVTDFVSWRIIMLGLENIIQGRPLPALSTSFAEWCQLQKLDAVNCNLTDLELAPPARSADEAFWGLDMNSNQTKDRAKAQSFTLDQETTRKLLLHGGRDSAVALVDLLLAVLAYGFRQKFPQREPAAFFLEGHGREPINDDIDLSDTVGWFTTLCPVTVPAEAFQTLPHCVKAHSESRRSAKQKGRAWFARQYYGEEGSKRHDRHRPLELIFNFRGLMQQLERSDALFESLSEDYYCEPDQMERFAIIDTSALVEHGCLTVSFEWNCHMLHQAELLEWVTLCQETFTHLAATEPDITTLTGVDEIDTTAAIGARMDSPMEFYGHSFEKTPDLHLSGISEAQYLKLKDAVLSNCSTKGGVPSIQDVLPLSPSQTGLLLAMWRNDTSYRDRLWFHVGSRTSEAVDLTRLSQGWQQVVKKHASLRTVMFDGSASDSQPLQVVLGNFSTPFETAKARDADAAIELHRNSPRDATLEPYQYMTFFELETGGVLCALDISHTVSDGWSQALLIRDVTQAYDGRLERQAASLRGFIEYLTPQRLSDATSYWKDYLQDAEACILPAFEADSTAEGTTYAELPLTDIDYRSVCRAIGVTPTVFLHTALALTLRLFAGTDSILFGCIASGRDIDVDDIENVFGALFSLTACHINVQPSDTIEELLRQRQEDHINGSAHQHFSISDVQHELGLSGKQLFNTICSVLPAPVQAEERDISLKVDMLDMDDPTEFDLSVNCVTYEKEVVVDFIGKKQKFSRRHLHQMARTFVSITRSMAEDPSQSVADLAVMDVAAQCNLIDEYRRAGADHWIVDGFNPSTLLPPGAYGEVLVRGQKVERSRLADPNRTRVQFVDAPSWAETEGHNKKGREKYYFSGHQTRMTYDVGLAETVLPGTPAAAAAAAAAAERDGQQAKSNSAAKDVATATAEIGHAPGAAEQEKQIADIWAKVLGLGADEFTNEDSFLDLGGDSVQAMRVATEARKAGLPMTVRDILRHPTVRELAAKAAEAKAKAAQAKPANASQQSKHQENVPFGLSAVQNMHFERDPGLQARYNQSVFLEMSPRATEPAVRTALTTIVQQHAMLRARFIKQSSSTCLQHIRSTADACLSIESCTASSSQELEQLVHQCHDRVNLLTGINLAASFIRFESRTLLFMTASHLLVDFVSWQIITDSIQEYLSSGKINPAIAPVSYQDWTVPQLKNPTPPAQAQDSQRALAFWGLSETRYRAESELDLTLSAPASARILSASSAQQPVDLMMSALLHSFSATFSQRALPAVHFEGHGRGGSQDVSQTVGWFAAFHRLAVPGGQHHTLPELAQRIRRARHDLLVEDPREPWQKSDTQMPFELLFNFTGGAQLEDSADAMLRPVQDLQCEVDEIDLDLRRFALLAVEATVEAGNLLSFKLKYDRGMRHQDALREWWALFGRTLSGV